MKEIEGQVDSFSSVMEDPGDKMATTQEAPTSTALNHPAPKHGKNGKPAAMVKFGSASVPVYRCDSGEIVAEMLLNREQDDACKVYLGQLKTTLNRFATRVPVEILEVTANDIDAWLRSLDVAVGTRNSESLHPI